MKSKPFVSDLEAHLGYWLRIVSNAVSHRFARRVEAEGVTVAEWVVLRALYDVDRIAPSLLAERLGMTKGAISKLSDRLVEKGLVKREGNPKDKRAHAIILELAGRKLVPRLALAADENDAAFFSTLSERERQTLKRLLSKVAVDRELRNVPTD